MILKLSNNPIQTKQRSSYSSFVNKVMSIMNNQIKRKFETQSPQDQLNKLQKQINDID